MSSRAPRSIRLQVYDIAPLDMPLSGPTHFSFAFPTASFTAASARGLTTCVTVVVVEQALPAERLDPLGPSPRFWFPTFFKKAAAALAQPGCTSRSSSHGRPAGGECGVRGETSITPSPARTLSMSSNSSARPSERLDASNVSLARTNRLRGSETPSPSPLDRPEFPDLDTMNDSDRCGGVSVSLSTLFIFFAVAAASCVHSQYLSFGEAVRFLPLTPETKLVLVKNVSTRQRESRLPSAKGVVCVDDITPARTRRAPS